MKKLPRLLAARNGAYQAREGIVVLDDPPWIDSVFSEMLARPTHILDGHYAVEHLSRLNRQKGGTPEDPHEDPSTKRGCLSAAIPETEAHAIP